jgi:dipeptidyl aminopeptidase/acylaminoacyl peptidase
VALAGAVVATVAVHGAGSPAPPPAASATASRDAVRLDAATVSARISRALTETEGSVLHIRMHVTLGAESSRNELWRDPVTGDQRATGPKVPGNPRYDVAVRFDGDTQTSTIVDHEHRRWWVETVPVVDVPRDGGDDANKRTPLGDFSPDGLRAALRRGDWTLVGEERLDGRDTVHLRITDRATYGGYDLWVDAGTFVLVRRVVEDADQALRLVEDYEYLPRTAAVLAGVRAPAVPEGFRQVAPPQPDTGPAPPGGRG